VIVDRKWKEVILTFNFKDTITSASFVVRKSYLSMLYHFEQVYYLGKQGFPSQTPGMEYEFLFPILVRNLTSSSNITKMEDIS